MPCIFLRCSSSGVSRASSLLLGAASAPAGLVRSKFLFFFTDREFPADTQKTARKPIGKGRKNRFRVSIILHEGKWLVLLISLRFFSLFVRGLEHTSGHARPETVCFQWSTWTGEDSKVNDTRRTKRFHSSQRRGRI